MHKIRWWPAALLVLLAGLGLAWIQLGESDGQERMMSSIALLLLLGFLLAMWVVFLSRLPWRVRGLVTAGLVGVVALAAALFEIRGVTGDLRPVLAFRWAGTPELPAPPAADPVSGSVAIPAVAPAGVDRGDLDYPGFLGARRDGTIRGVRLDPDWVTRPPQVVWRQPIGAGWSGFAVADGQAFTQEQRGNEELVVRYDLATGAVRWIHADPGRYDTTIAGVGPRATPTVVEDRVFTLGALGRLNALDRETGRRIWGRDAIEENGGQVPEWGKSSSPLVVDGLVVVNVGGSGGRSIVAYHADSGKRAWSGGEGTSSYSSPLLTEIAGRRQVVILSDTSLAAHDPATGRTLWEVPWPAGQPNVSVPVVLPGDRLFASSGYGIGGKLFQIEGSDQSFTGNLLWETPRLKAKFTNVVYHEGHLYGLDDGTLVCLDPATGERRWRDGRYGHGQVILVEDLLLVQTEDGAIALVETDPTSYREIARFQALSGKTWNPPALAGPYLLVRNDQEAACYRLPLATP